MFDGGYFNNTPMVVDGGVGLINCNLSLVHESGHRLERN